MIVTVQLPKNKYVFPFCFEASKYGLEYEEMAGNQVEIIGDETKIGYVLQKFPATIIHKEHFKYF